MIIPDVNILVYAFNEDAPDHEVARDWWGRILNGTERVGLPWMVSAGFVRISTNPNATPNPLKPSEAVRLVRDWLNYSHVAVLEPGPDHLDLLDRNLTVTGTGGNLVTDAHIAAIAIEYDAVVHSADSDFGRFPGLRWHNPLKPVSAR